MCAKGKKNKKIEKGKGDEKMTTYIKPKPIKSTEINFETEEEYREFMEYVQNPPETSEYVKELIKTYQKQSEKEQ